MTVIPYDHPDARSIETQLVTLAPRFGDVLGSVMQPERLIRSIMISMDRNRELFKCDRQSIVLAAMSAACIGLEADGVLGLSFLVPFNVKGRGKVAQMMTGYKGYNTLAGRGGFTIRSGVVRKGDEFEFDKASGEIHHRVRKINDGDIVATWARAVSNSQPAVIEVVGIDELMELRSRAKSTQGDGGSFSPWLDPKIGFPAMCEKTPKRRLARSLPFGRLAQFAMAARVDEAVEEQGRHAWITPESGVTVGGAPFYASEPTKNQQPVITVSTERAFPELPPDLAQKAAKLKASLETLDSVSDLDAQWEKVPKTLAKIKVISEKTHDALVELYDRRRVILSELEESSTR